MMVKHADIAAFVIQKLGEETGADFSNARLSDRFVDDLHIDEIDSLAATEMLVDVEEHYDITITDAEAAQLHTIGDLVDFIARRTRPSS